MGASDILNVLNKAERPLTSAEISGLCEIGRSSVKRLLRALNKDVSVDLKFRVLGCEERKKMYGKVLNISHIRVYWLGK